MTIMTKNLIANKNELQRASTNEITNDTVKKPRKNKDVV